jgi:V8-like Glu-specific endopeptidase
MTRSNDPKRSACYWWPLLGAAALSLFPLSCKNWSQQNPLTPDETRALSTPTPLESRPPVSESSAQDTEKILELQAFSSEELLREVRVRELGVGTNLPDLVLERQAEERKQQSFLRNLKMNPRLAGYRSEDLVQGLIVKQRALYGHDDRKDVYLLSADPKLKAAADAVVSLFDSKLIVPSSDGKTSTIEMKMYGSVYGLCDTELFYTQPCSAFCSGVLVAPDLIATAGHCIDTPQKKTPPIQNIRFVFGYRMRADKTPELVIKNEDIYSGTLVKRTYTLQGQDWAIVKLDRPVTRYAPMPLRRTSKIADMEEVYVIGHPCGLPAKFANGATVRSNSDADFFVANLDTYAGNSGSPVFNKRTNEIEGLLVRGQKDFVSKDPSDRNSCQISFPCPNSGCRGEDCVRTPIFASLVPNDH